MAITNQQSAQIANAADRLYPVEYHGKMRISYFDFTQGVAAGDIASTADLCTLPQGRIRILPQNSRISWSAFGAARTLSVGLRAYTTEHNVAVAEDAAALMSGADVSAADADGTPLGLLIKFDIFSTKSVLVFAKVAGGTIPAGATIKGYVVYVQD